MKLASTLAFLLLLFTSSINGQLLQSTMEKKVLAVYEKSMATKSNQFDSLYTTINHIEFPQKYLLAYWTAYTKFQHARFLQSMSLENKALRCLKEGIQLLETVQKPNSEVLVLQGTMVSYSIVFQRNLAAILSGKAEALYARAMQKNSKNMRVYLAIGKSDFFTPTQYGGGFKVESYLKKALGLPAKNSTGLYAPSWGKQQVYYYLASYLFREQRVDEGLLFCKQGLLKFPTSSLLQKLLTKHAQQ